MIKFEKLALHSRIILLCEEVLNIAKCGKQEVYSLERLVVNGGNKLEGNVSISGAKNAALAVLVAALLSTGESLITNIPQIDDVYYLCEILKSFGADVEFVQDNSIRIKVDSLGSTKMQYDLAKKLRASNLVLGAVLARVGEVEIPLPGGCRIGSRPMDLHIKGMRMLGADIKLEHGYIRARAKKLKGASIYLDFPSVGATENIIMAASMAEGSTIIENCAKEPEIVDLANYLNIMGAKIKGAGTSTIKVEGVTKLQGMEYTVIPDRIEASTYLAAAIATRGKVLIENIILKHIEPVIAKFKEVGVSITEYEDRILVDANGKLRSVDIKTLPYPGFPTDVQPVFAAVLAKAQGTSIITETIFGNRFMYADELKRMGAEIMVDGGSAVIVGVEGLENASVSCCDLRGGAALVIAALSAEGTSDIQIVEHIRRGYEKLDEKLKALGGDVYYV